MSAPRGPTRALAAKGNRSRRDRVIGASEGRRVPGALVQVQAPTMPPPVSHRRLKVDPRKEGRRDSAAVATV